MFISVNGKSSQKTSAVLFKSTFFPKCFRRKKAELSIIKKLFLKKNKGDNIHKQRSSFASCSLTDRPTEKYLQNRCSYTRGICTQKMRALSYIGAEKITFPNKPDIQTDIQTDGRTLAVIEQLLKKICTRLNLI